jgi:hypothetical protein
VAVFGHQANSRATGGKGLGGSMAVVVSHADQVLELPAGAQLLASSKSAAAEIWSHGTNVLAVQGHPEMTSALCITKVVPALVAKGLITAAEGEAAVASLQVRNPHIIVRRRRRDSRVALSAGPASPPPLCSLCPPQRATSSCVSFARLKVKGSGRRRHNRWRAGALDPLNIRPRMYERSQTPPAAAALMLNMAKYFLRGHPPRGGAAEAAAAAVRLFGPSSLPADPIPSRGVLASFMGGMGRDTSGSHVGGDDGGTATLRTLMDEMFHKVTAAVTGELQATANEYHLLRDMNLVASDKYQQMGDFAEGMLVFVEVGEPGGHTINPLRCLATVRSASGQPYLQALS